MWFYYLVRWAGNPLSQPLQSHASRFGHMPPVPSLFPPPLSFSHAPGTLPTQHGTSPDGYAVGQLINRGNTLLNAYSEKQSQFQGFTWSITSLGFSASLFSLVSRPLGGIRIYRLREKSNIYSLASPPKQRIIIIIIPERCHLLGHLSVLLHQFGEVVEKAVLWPQKVKLVVPLFFLHELSEKLAAIASNKLGSELDNIQIKC